MTFDDLKYRAEYWTREVIRREKLGLTAGVAYAAAMSNWSDAEERLAVAMEGARLGKEGVMDWEFGEDWWVAGGEIQGGDDTRPRNSLICTSKGAVENPFSVLREVRECLEDDEDEEWQKECPLIGVILPSGRMEVRIAPFRTSVSVWDGDVPIPTESSDLMSEMFEEWEKNYRRGTEDWLWSGPVFDGVEEDKFVGWLICKGEFQRPVVGIETVDGDYILYLYQCPEGSRVVILE